MNLKIKDAIDTAIYTGVGLNVISGCLTVDSLETTDRLPKMSEVSGLFKINIRYLYLKWFPSWSVPLIHKSIMAVMQNPYHCVRPWVVIC